MTIANETAVTEGLIANGISTQWPFEFYVDGKSSITLIVRDANGVDFIVDNTNFGVDTMDLQNPNGGIVNYPLTGPPLAIGHIVFIARNEAFKQDITFGGSQGGFNPRIVENALDKLTRSIQELRRDAERSLKVGYGSDVTAIKEVVEVISTAGGIANALTLTINSDIAGYVDGLVLVFRATVSNTGPATINVNMMGVKSIRRMADAVETALTADMIRAGGIYTLSYSAAADGGAGAFLLLSPMLDSDSTSFVTLTGTQTLTNKTLTGATLTSPIIDTGMEIGHATDTTVARGAAGFLDVEGKRIPSPAGQVEGDILYRGATEWERLAKGTAQQVLKMNAGATAPEWGNGGGGTLIYASTAAFTRVTTAIPADDTVPLISEGTEILTAGITPSTAAKKVRVSVSLFASGNTNGGDVAAAVFRGSTCIDVRRYRPGAAVGGPTATLAFDLVDSPASASLQTYSVRFGPSGSDTFAAINGDASANARVYGGAAKCSLTLEEVS